MKTAGGVIQLVGMICGIVAVYLVGGLAAALGLTGICLLIIGQAVGKDD